MKTTMQRGLDSSHTHSRFSPTIVGGNDKQGFPMRQGVLTNKRVRLLMQKGMLLSRGSLAFQFLVLSLPFFFSTLLFLLLSVLFL